MINFGTAGHISGTPLVDAVTNNTPVVEVPVTPEGVISLFSDPIVLEGGFQLTLVDPIIYGTVTINGVVYSFPDNPGTPDDVLTIDGAGAVTWLPAVNSLDFGTTGLTTGATQGNLTVSGVLTIENGGTGADNAIDAANNLLPDQTGHANESLTTDGAGNLTWQIGRAHV